MAGSYPDVPSNRMAYDRDGTQVYKIDQQGVYTQLTSAQIQNLNDEDDDSPIQINGQNNSGTLFFYFPEPRDFGGFFIADTNIPGGLAQASIGLSVSSDTTNGLDGSWTVIQSGMSALGPVRPTYRTSITSVARFGVRGIRFTSQSGAPSFGWNPSAVHLYGNISAGSNTKRVALWHPTSDLHIGGAYFDFGNAPRGSSADKTFRVKNLSPTMTAQSINLGLDAMTDTTPSVPGQYLLSTDGTNFAGSVNIGDLAPSGISPVLTLRRNTPSNATLSVWAARLLAQATSWA